MGCGGWLLVTSGVLSGRVTIGQPAIEIRRALPANSTAFPAEVIEVRRATLALPPLPNLAPATDFSGISSYIGHRVRNGETLENIAALGGSSVAWLKKYNLLQGSLIPGRMIIVPQLQGLVSARGSEACIVEQGSPERARIAVTVDAGSGAEPVAKLLKALRDRGVKITFFVTGYFIRENPALMQQIAAEGHEFGNHSLSHPDLTKVDDMRIRRELLETERLLQHTTGRSSRPFFRPPYGAYNNRVLLAAESLGFLPIYWTLDSLDSVGPKKSAHFLFQRVTTHLTADKLPGAIILMHCDSMATADAMPAILDHFKSIGLEVTKLSRVLNDG